MGDTSVCTVLTSGVIYQDEQSKLQLFVNLKASTVLTSLTNPIVTPDGDGRRNRKRNVVSYKEPSLNR